MHLHVRSGGQPYLPRAGLIPFRLFPLSRLRPVGPVDEAEEQHDTEECGSEDSSDGKSMRRHGKTDQDWNQRRGEEGG